MSIQTVTEWIAIISFISGAFSFWWGHTNQRKQAIIEAYRELEDTLVEIEKIEPAEYRILAENSKRKEYKLQYIEVRAKIARIEHFCVGVKNGTYHNKTAFELGGLYLNKTIYRRITPIIDASDSHSQFSNYSNTRWMMSKLDQIEKKRRRQNKP